MKKNFNDGWSFLKSGETWKKVNLPHDAMLEEKRTADAGGKSAAGFFPGGKYSYEKEFEITENELGKHFTVEFEGVYKNAIVYINDAMVCQHAYGYTGFFVCLDGYIKAGKNILRVETDNEQQPDSRWYTGAGIYRPVWLHVQEPEHIAVDGIKIRTLSVKPAKVQICTEHCGGDILVEIMNQDKETVASGQGDCVELEIPAAQLWSADAPVLYTAKVMLAVEGKAVECVEEEFGIRVVSWDNKGLYINGEKTLLRGGCIHHDNGILGACEYDESAARKIQILKEIGFNAIRSSHNPCSKAILKACDRYGMYVMDETWDMWYQKKSAYDYANEFLDHYREDIEAIVDKDYNHPSVIMYSIGNEISEPAKQKGVELAREMTQLFHELDDSRAVTGGFNLMIIANAAKGSEMYKEEGGLNEQPGPDMSTMDSTTFNMIASMTGSGMNNAANSDEADAAVSPVLDTVDIAGYNYASGRYEIDGELHPGRLILGSETFPQDLPKNWQMVEKYPHLVGDFMWTAWDYLGEAGLGAWSYEKDAMGFAKPYPWLLADTGVFDILGNPTGEALWAKAVWRTDCQPQIAVRPVNHPDDELIMAAWRGTNAIPSWSWRHCDGNKATVEVYTSAPQVELYINQSCVGKEETSDMRAVFEVQYAPGELCAVALDADGNEIGRSSLISAEGNLAVCLKPEKEEVKPGEIVYIDVCIADAKGIVDTGYDDDIRIEVENGALLGFGSANPRTEESFQAKQYKTYYGHAQAVVLAGEEGAIKVSAIGNSLGASEITIRCKAEEES